jgi:hypothetical protein
VSVLLGNGNGSFQSAVNFGVGLSPYSVAVADVNGDGRPDLAVADKGSNSLSVLVGNGDGTFRSTTNCGVASRPDSVAVADLNGDGRLDLVAANGSGGLVTSNSVSVLLGNRNAATHFLVSAPVSATAGTAFTITVTGLTGGNQLDALYTGTIHFTSSDGQAGLPVNYTFTKGDLGAHTFTVTLQNSGSQTVTAADTKNKSITGTATVIVNTAGPSPPMAGGLSGSAAPDSAGDNDHNHAAALAAQLADRPPWATDSAQHPLAATSGPLVSGSRPVAEQAARTFAHRVPASAVANVRRAPALPSAADPRAGGLRLTDVEAFFAVESV